MLNNFGKSFALLFDIFGAISILNSPDSETDLQQRLFQAFAKIEVIEVPNNSIRSSFPIFTSIR
jgi:hypothetical protein